MEGKQYHIQAQFPLYNLLAARRLNCPDALLVSKVNRLKKITNAT